MKKPSSDDSPEAPASRRQKRMPERTNRHAVVPPAHAPARSKATPKQQPQERATETDGDRVPQIPFYPGLGQLGFPRGASDDDGRTDVTPVMRPSDIEWTGRQVLLPPCPNEHPQFVLPDDAKRSGVPSLPLATKMRTRHEDDGAGSSWHDIEDDDFYR